ncbi:MAG: helix-turn-helix transcriptional regulator [Alphaproteobacteria bacterium]|nr:helix-turn-helix transcriptional regulator [Alphaproteobacteria bacterium]
MSCETQKNKIALQYSLEMAKNLSVLSDFFTQPLGLTTFGYKRVYQNGRYLFLSTNQDWLKYHYQNVKDHGAFFQEAMDTAHLNHSYRVLWPSARHDHFLDALNHFGMWHGINFYKWRDDYLELWTFSTSCDRGGISQIYLNTLPYFEEFIHYFNLKSSEIININDKEKLAQFEHCLPSPSLQNNALNPLTEIINLIKIDKFLINGPNGLVTLTKRESECLKLLGTGKSAKEVAAVLQISPRTVECYVNQIKEKTGCYSKSKLLKSAQSFNLD